MSVSHVLLVPTTTRAGGPGGRVVTVPNLGGIEPAWWGQTSSAWRGKQAVVVTSPDPGIVDKILAAVPTAEHLGPDRTTAAEELARISAAMRTDHSGPGMRTPGTFNEERERVRRGDIREWTYATRSFVTSRESSELTRQRTAQVAGTVARLLLAGFSLFALHAALASLLPAGVVALALTRLHQDHFNYTGDVDGHAMSDGIGAWSVDMGTFNATGAVCECNSNGDSYIRDSVASPVDIQRTFIQWVNGAVNRTGGPMTRMDFGGGTMSGFQNFKKGDHFLDMYRIVDDAYTLIGSDRTSALSNGSFYWMGSNGTTQTGGTNDFGAEVTLISVTDSANATGVGGVYGDVNTFDFDKFDFYVDSGGGGGATNVVVCSGLL